MDDKTLLCSQCGQNFVFTVGEQEFFQEKGFQEPKFCKPCRQARKQERQKQRQLYDVVCAACGTPTQVPFVPDGVRPVYCQTCYREVIAPQQQ